MDQNTSYDKIMLHLKTEKDAVIKLNEYIKNQERRYGRIPSPKVLSRRNLKLIKLMGDLLHIIEKEEIEKDEAFQLLKASNDAIKATISTFEDSMGIYKEAMRSEFAKLDCLSTNRLLNISYK